MDNSPSTPHQDGPRSFASSPRSVFLDHTLTKVQNINQFKVGDKLGEGTFGVVKLAIHTLTGERVAIKVLEKSKIRSHDDKVRLEREINILQKLHHTNVIRLYQVIDTTYTKYLVQEYASGKELYEYIVAKKKLDEMEACKYFQQIISGIEYIHKMQVTHRDMKPENMILTSHKNIKIVDFGLSNTYKKNEYLSTPCGSPCYAAPEMLSGKKYRGLSVDIWSCGVILFIMICGTLPFEDNNNQSLYKKIIAGKYTIPKWVSKAGKDLIKKILETNPKKRITIPDIKKHKWFNLIDPKENFHNGINTKTTVIPIDEEIVDKMRGMGYIKKEVRESILRDENNNITTTYYLLLRRKVRAKLTSVSDLKSEEFEEYLKDPENAMEKYNNNIQEVVEKRAIKEGEVYDSLVPEKENIITLEEATEKIGSPQPKRSKALENFSSALSENQNDQKKNTRNKNLEIQIFTNYKPAQTENETNKKNIRKIGGPNFSTDTQKKHNKSNSLKKVSITTQPTIRKRNSQGISNPLNSYEAKHKHTSDKILTQKYFSSKTSAANTKRFNNTTIKTTNSSSAKGINVRKKIEHLKISSCSTKTIGYNSSQIEEKSKVSKGTAKNFYKARTQMIYPHLQTNENSSYLQTEVHKTNKTSTKAIGRSLSACKKKKTTIKPKPQIKKQNEPALSKNKMDKDLKESKVESCKEKKVKENLNEAEKTEEKKEEKTEEKKEEKTEEKKEEKTGEKKEEKAEEKKEKKTEECQGNNTVEPIFNRRESENRKGTKKLQSNQSLNLNEIVAKVDTGNQQGGEKLIKKTCKTPFDLGTIFCKDVIEIKQKITNLLNTMKIKYQIDKKNGFSFYCQKVMQQLSFNIEILKAEDFDGGIVKIKKLNGSIVLYSKLIHEVYSRLNELLK